MSNYRTYGRNYMTCPFCGCEDPYSEEMSTTYGTNSCAECGKEYEWESMVLVTYNTEGSDE